MSVVLGNVSDKTFGWLVIGSLLVCWAVLLPVVLAVDSRLVFGLCAAAVCSWLLIVAVRMIQMNYKFIGWGIIAPLGLFLVLSVFTTQGVPLTYITLVFTGWAGYRLVRGLQHPATIHTTSA